MATVNLDSKGRLINIENVEGVNAGLTFHYKSDFSISEGKKSVTGIYVGGEAVATIQYNSDQSISGVFPGKAKDKVKVNIG